MFAKPVERCLGVALLAVGLAGCIEQRRGLGPIIDAASVESASSNTRRILQALALDAGVDPVAPSDWYLVAEAGFNYIDDQCKAYFHEQFSLGSERAGTRSGVTAAGQATAAILSVTGSPAMGLAVLAQALGLGASATDLAAGSYVSRLPPTTTYDFVQRLQRAFRAAAAGHRARINTPTAAYYVIQRYLDLCLPPRIEVEITKQITLAGTVQAPRGGGSLFPAEIASVPSASVPSMRSGTVVAGRSGGVVGGALSGRSRTGSGTGEAGGSTRPSPEGPVASDSVRVGLFEKGLAESQIMGLQKAACLDADGQFTAKTRNALLAFLNSKNLKDQSFPDRITAKDGARLRSILEEGSRC